MYARRLLLAALVIPACTLSCPLRDASLTAAPVAPATRGARLDPPRTLAVSITSSRFDITQGEQSGNTNLERPRSGVFLRVPDNDGAEDTSLTAQRFNLYRTRAGSVWIV